MERTEEKEAVESFFKDERDGSGREARTVRRPYEQRGRFGNDDRKRSFNPNFDRENKVRRPWNDRKEGSHRSYRQSDGEPAERKSFSRGFDRGDDGHARTGRFFDRRSGEGRGFENDDRRERRDRYDNDRNFRRDDNRDGYRQREGRSFDRPSGERRPYHRNDRFNDRNSRHEEGREPRFGSTERRPSYDNGRNFGSERGRYEDRRTSFDRDNNKGFSPERKKYRPRIVKEPYTPEVAFTAEPLINREIRLNRYIAMSGVCSRREADSYIQSGAVSVNGTVVTELGTKIKPGDEVCFNDQVIRGEKKVYIVMNKPKGFVTTVDDPNANGHTVMDILGDKVKERIYPVGRLDKQTMGVLLFTNDGDLTRELTHPSYEKKKIYHVFLDKDITEEDMEKLAAGVELEDGIAFADEISYTGKTKKEIGIEIHNGRNRIVRRMLESLGYKVTKLDRVYFAGLTKKGLKRGFWRYLTEKEVTALKSGLYS